MTDPTDCCVVVASSSASALVPVPVAQPQFRLALALALSIDIVSQFDSDTGLTLLTAVAFVKLQQYTIHT